MLRVSADHYTHRNLVRPQPPTTVPLQLGNESWHLVRRQLGRGRHPRAHHVPGDGVRLTIHGHLANISPFLNNAFDLGGIHLLTTDIDDLGRSSKDPDVVAVALDRVA